MASTFIPRYVLLSPLTSNGLNNDNLFFILPLLQADWNDQAAVMVSQQGANAPAFMKYIASKVLAERAAWAWINDHKTTFDLTTVLPPWVWGVSVTCFLLSSHL